MTHTADNDAACRHGVSLVSRIGGPTAYCETCTDAFMENPRYYADALHVSAPPDHGHDWRHYGTGGAAVERCLTCDKVRTRPIPPVVPEETP
jgi:hypothetical protein